MKEILLSPIEDGIVSLVSDEDYDRLSKHTWSAVKTPYTWYATSRISGRNIRMHRFITDAPDDMDVDHWDRDGLHNWRENLRVCTISQNQHNSKTRKDNTSGYKGVSFNKKHYRYHARIHLHGKVKNLGYFEDPKDAALAYDTAAKEMFGEFARTNF